MKFRDLSMSDDVDKIIGLPEIVDVFESPISIVDEYDGPLAGFAWLTMFGKPFDDARLYYHCWGEYTLPDGSWHRVYALVAVTHRLEGKFRGGHAGYFDDIHKLFGECEVVGWCRW